MKVLVRAPKCRNGELKNHKSVIGEKSVKWVDGIALVEEETWELLKSVPGYSLAGDIQEPITDETEKEKELAAKLEAEKDELETKLEAEKKEPAAEQFLKGNIDKYQTVFEFPTMDSTGKDIKEFASKCVPPIDLSKDKNKTQMLKRIKDHFAK